MHPFRDTTKDRAATDELIPCCTSRGDPIRTLTYQPLPQPRSCRRWSPSSCRACGLPTTWDFAVGRRQPRRHQNPGECPQTPGDELDVCREAGRDVAGGSADVVAAGGNGGGPGSTDIDLPAELKRRQTGCKRARQSSGDRTTGAGALRARTGRLHRQPSRTGGQGAGAGRKLGGNQPPEPLPGPGPKLRSISPTQTRGSCRVRAGVRARLQRPSHGGYEPLLVVGAHVTQRPTTNRQSRRRSRTWRSGRRLGSGRTRGVG